MIIIINSSYFIKRGASQKRRLFLKIENIPDLFSYDREDKIIENIDLKYSSNQAFFMRNSVQMY